MKHFVLIDTIMIKRNQISNTYNVTSFQVLHIRQVHKLIFFDLYITWYLNKHINFESLQIIYEKVLLESNSFDRGRKIYIHHQSFSRYMNNDNTSLFLY